MAIVAVGSAGRGGGVTVGRKVDHVLTTGVLSGLVGYPVRVESVAMVGGGGTGPGGAGNGDGKGGPGGTGGKGSGVGMGGTGSGAGTGGTGSGAGIGGTGSGVGTGPGV